MNVFKNLSDYRVWLFAGLILLISGARIEAEDESVLRGVILLKSEDGLLKEGDPGLDHRGVEVKGDLALGAEELRGKIQPLLGEKIDEALLKRLQAAIREAYRARGFTLVDPVFPPQAVSKGVLQVIVVEGILGKVQFEGTNRWTESSYLRRNLRLTEGNRINEFRLLEDVQWLNRNPFRTVDVFYKPGENRFESDVVVRTEERFPLGFFGSVDNTGNALTGEERFTVGLDWAKAFGLTDNIFSYRYSSDLELEFLQSHSLSVQSLLPWRHTLTLSGAYADVGGDVPGSPISHDGSSYLGSVRYGIPLPRIRQYRHEFSIGGEFKHLENNLQFNYVSVLEEATQVAQALVAYNGLLPDDWGSTFAGTEFYYSPGDLTDRNDDTAFSASYPSAESEYMYGRFTLERLTRLPYGMTWRANGMYQWADGNLIPSEQLGLGGAFTVRGYEERITSGAEGFMASTELRSPSFSPGRWLDRTAKDEMQLLGFFDYGQTSNKDLQRGEDAHVILMSAGVGFRYHVTRHFNARFDYGWPLEDLEFRRSSNPRAHFSISLAF